MKKTAFLVSAILTIGAYSIAAPQNGTQTTIQNETQIGNAQADVQVKVNIFHDIQQLVEQVKNASPSEKYIYMNQLKQKLRELSVEERREVIHEIVKELKSAGKEKALEHVSGKNEKAEKEVSEEHNVMKRENKKHAEERGSMRMKIERKHDMETSQERMMDREREMEERKSDIQERINFRYRERKERGMEHKMMDRQTESDSNNHKQGNFNNSMN